MFNQQTERKIEKLFQLAQKDEDTNKHFEAIEKYEKAKKLLQNKQNYDKEKLSKCNKKICELSNMLSILFLQQENYKACFELLKKAEVCAKNSPDQLSLTYNNYACFYKAMGKYRVALSFLQETLQIEKKRKCNKNISDTFLNICAVLSKLKKHKEAFQASLNSIVLIQEELLNFCLPIALGQDRRKTEKFQLNKEVKKPPKNKENFPGQTLNKKAQKKHPNEEQDQLYQRVIVLAIAYHNLAVELEHLKLFNDSLDVYQKAHHFANNVLGENTEVVDNLKKIVSDAQIQLKEKLKKRKKDN